MTLKKGLLRKSGIYLIIDNEALKGRDAATIVLRSLEAGIDMVQFRGKGASDREFLEAASRIKDLLRGTQALFIVNDRVDLAVRLDADGVHLGQDDMSVETARKMLGEEGIIGLSTHSEQEMREAAKKDVDYISVGPVFETPTKLGCKAVGLELVELAAKEARKPFVAIGGINASNIRDVVASGAKRIAVVRAILSSDDPFIAAKDLMERIA